MADTTNKSLQRPANGSNIDVWDVPLNSNFTILDQALGGITSLNATGVTAYTLTSAQYIPLSIYVSGAQSASVVYTIPAGISGQWVVYNTTTDSVGGPWSVTIASGGGGTSVVVQRNKSTIVLSDGTNIRPAYAESLSAIFPSGTAILFVQTSAPTGWTKSTAHDNKALRIVSGAASSGGSVAFTTAFTSQAVAGVVGDTTLTINQIPSHTHGYVYYRGPFSGETTSSQAHAGTLINGTTAATGGGLSHTHTFTGTAINLAVSYVDVIIATKD